MNGEWYVLRTRPRTEKKLQAMLLAWNISSVLPTYVKVRKVQRRTVKTDIPVFPGYMMAKLDAGERLRVLKTNLALDVFPAPDAQAALRGLDQIAKAIGETEEFSIVPPASTGDAVRVVRGPMKGVEGRVKTVDGRTFLAINVEAFGGAVEIRVSAEDCVPA